MTCSISACRATPRRLSGGLTNRLWRLTTARGVFAVKEMNRDFDRADYVGWFDRAFSLEQASFRAGVPMPRPVPIALTGRCLAELPHSEDRPMTVRVHEWVEGVKLDNSTAYPADVATRVAMILARIHSLRMQENVDIAEALPVFGDEHWRARAEQVEQAGAEWAPEFRWLLPSLTELEAYLVVAHNDATPLLLSHRDAD